MDIPKIPHPFEALDNDMQRYGYTIGMLRTVIDYTRAVLKDPDNELRKTWLSETLDSGTELLRIFDERAEAARSTWDVTRSAARVNAGQAYEDAKNEVYRTVSKEKQ